MRPRRAAIALSGAAMSLPVFAANQPAETTLSVRFSNYDEASISRDDVLTGATDRYDIDVSQFRLVSPIGRQWSIAIDAAKEVMSGASPWGTFFGFDGTPNLVMSGATIRDSRTEVAVTTTWHGDDQSYSLGFARSREDDYRATSVNVGGEWDFNESLSTLATGFSYSRDELNPTDAIMFGRVPGADKHSRSLSVSWTQVINRQSVLQAGIAATEHEGFLKDPYKLRDIRPDRRLEWAVSLKYRRYFDNQNAALHLDYRYYDDDWGIDSHTVDFSWHQNLGISFQLVPRLRYYSQSEASFYQDADDYLLPASQSQSSDFRLSGYGAWTVGLKAVYNATRWSANASIDRYKSSDSYGHAASSYEHPALLEFTLTSIGLDWRF